MLENKLKEIAKDERVVEFADEEAEFLGRNRLARIATVSTNGQPHVVPVGFEFDGRFFYFGGWNLKESLKFRNIGQNSRVALVVDDLESVNPWRPRGLEIRGQAEIIDKEEEGVYVRIKPIHKISWGIVKTRKEKSERS